MAFEEIKENSEDLLNQAKAFLDGNVSYYKLWLFKATMKSTTMLLKLLLLSIMLVIVTIFFSIAAALAIGYGLGNFVYGFLIVGGAYLIISIIVYKVQDDIVEGPILKKFSEYFFNE